MSELPVFRNAKTILPEQTPAASLFPLNLSYYHSGHISPLLTQQMSHLRDDEVCLKVSSLCSHCFQVLASMSLPKQYSLLTRRLLGRREQIEIWWLAYKRKRRQQEVRWCSICPCLRSPLFHVRSYSVKNSQGNLRVKFEVLANFMRDFSRRILTIVTLKWF